MWFDPMVPSGLREIISWSTGGWNNIKRSSLVKVFDTGVDKVFSKGKFAAVIKGMVPFGPLVKITKGNWEMAPKLTLPFR